MRVSFRKGPTWTGSSASGLILLAAIGSTRASDIRIPKYKDYVTPPALALPEGSFPRGTITLLCSPDDWPRFLGDVPPPSWLADPPGTAILVGPSRRPISCENVELRSKSSARIVTFPPTSDSAPAAPGGCAIKVSRTVRGEPIVVNSDWLWKWELGTVRTCGESVRVPETDHADLLRVRLSAHADDLFAGREFEDTRVQLIGPNRLFNKTATAGSDDVAVFHDVPATSDYELVIQPPACGRFKVRRRLVPSGRDVVLEINLGSLASLSVQAKQLMEGAHAPVPGAHVRAFPRQIRLGYTAEGQNQVTDSQGRVVFDCLPTDAPVDIRVSRRGFWWSDLCGVQVGPTGSSSVPVILKPNPDPRRRPIPALCSEEVSNPAD